MRLAIAGRVSFIVSGAILLAFPGVLLFYLILGNVVLGIAVVGVSGLVQSILFLPLWRKLEKGRPTSILRPPNDE